MKSEQWVRCEDVQHRKTLLAFIERVREEKINKVHSPCKGALQGRKRLALRQSRKFVLQDKTFGRRHGTVRT